jgi:hypothetical protein
MKKNRRIGKVIRSKPMIEGAGALTDGMHNFFRLNFSRG